MRLISARFENFRLLRDLELEFSQDHQRKLTVIRAANETGKTTVLTGLQWALYGDGALPNKGESYRLHPIDWDVNAGRRVPITVSVDFEVVRHNKIAGTLRESRRRYRLIRSAIEELNGSEWRRTSTAVKLLAIEATGTLPIDSPEAVINNELPPELREVFFTDGDRALSFIESDVAVSTKRERVQRAIRALLGLAVIEDAMRHVKKAAAESNKHAQQLETGSELARIAKRLGEITDEVSTLEADQKDADDQFSAFDEKLSEVDRHIAQALKKGDKEKLSKDLEGVRRAIARLDEQIVAANKEHSVLFRSEALARDLLAPVFPKALELLRQLHDQGKIPNTTIPVLEERLAIGSCICGESLDSKDPEGGRRCRHVADLIEASRRSDEIQSTVTDLYYGSRSLEQRRDDGERLWIAAYTKVVKQRDGLQTLRDEEGRKLKALEAQIDGLPNTDIQALRETRRHYLEQRDRFHAKKTRVETQLEGRNSERERITVERDQLLRQQQRGAKIISELEVATDIGKVLKRAYDVITTTELAKVSALMNSLFLEMIGADPEQGAIIRRAEISPEFDIVVYGPEGRTLNPDRDLNGASRRALTLSFILALTKVSEVEAPNVIDTPLGMMSGYVKRSVLNAAIRESSQLILFLTQDEIKGCEEILDQQAGVVCTMTNSAHFPTMLVNAPGVSEKKVIRCSCSHRQQCRLCERRLEVDANNHVLA